MSLLRNLLRRLRKRYWEDGDWGLSLRRVTACRSPRHGVRARGRRSRKVAMIGHSPTGLAAPDAVGLPIPEIPPTTSRHSALPFQRHPATRLFGKRTASIIRNASTFAATP